MRTTTHQVFFAKDHIAVASNRPDECLRQHRAEATHDEIGALTARDREANVRLRLSAFHSSEAARLLRLARAQRVAIAPLEELLVRHLRLVRSGVGGKAEPAKKISKASARASSNRV